MSVTPTPNIALEKPTPGTEIGTWGPIVNTNYDILDGYIGGTTLNPFDIPFTGNPTFSGTPSFTANPTFSGNPVFSGDPVFSGSPAFSGSLDLLLSSYNNIECPIPGSLASADLEITAAEARLPSTGGIVDARVYGTTQQTIANQLVIGSATKPVILLLDNNTVFRITVTGGVDAIQLWTKCAIIADGPNAATATFQVQAAANISSVIANQPVSSAQSIIRIEGVSIQDNTSATVSGALLELACLTDNTSLRHVTIYNIGNRYGLRLSNASGAAVGPCSFYDCSFNGSGNAGAKPVLIRAVAGGAAMVGINFYGCSFTHPGPGGLSIVDLQGSATNAIQGVNFIGCQMESSNTGDIGLNIVDSTGIYADTLIFSANVNNGTSCVKISQSAGVAYAIKFGMLLQSNAWTNTIQDTINSVNITDPRVVDYKLLPPTTHSNDTYGASGLIMGMNATGIVLNKPVTTYNGIATVSGGVPSELATIDTTGLVAAVTTATLYTPTATGMFRISAALKITTTGTSPVAGPITITYTDGDGSVAQSVVMALKSVTGTIVTTTVNNSTTTGTVNGDMVIHAKTGVAIQYAIAVSGTFGAGVYSAHFKVEAL